MESRDERQQRQVRRKIGMDTINILLSRLFGGSFISIALCKKHIPQGELTKAEAAAAKHRHCPRKVRLRTWQVLAGRTARCPTACRGVYPGK